MSVSPTLTKAVWYTERLLLRHWHTQTTTDQGANKLADIIVQLLTPAVTAELPPDWQGHFTTERAQAWIKDRDAESINFLVINKANLDVVGLVILFEQNDGDLRLGYLLSESTWGKGLATELISELVNQCRLAGFQSITGGVARDNIASQRVLIKSGFTEQTTGQPSGEKLFTVYLRKPAAPL